MPHGSIADRNAGDFTQITRVNLRPRNVDYWSVDVRQFWWFGNGKRWNRPGGLRRLRSCHRYRGRRDRSDRFKRQRTTRVGEIGRRKNRGDEDCHDDCGVRTYRNSESPGPHRPPCVKASPAGLLHSTPGTRAGSSAAFANAVSAPLRDRPSARTYRGFAAPTAPDPAG
jgi:hypothetical protein